MTAKLLLVKSENGLETRQDYDGLPADNPTFTGALTGDSVALTGGMDAGGEIKSGTLAGTGMRPVVALADGTIDDQPPATFLGTIGALSASLKGAANGVAELGADGRVPSGQLPSYVDDVLEFASFAALPGTGETGKIYITQDNNKTWRWSGSVYAEISSSLALGETLATAYRGDRGAIAYNHSQLTAGNPHGTTAADVGALAKITLTGTIDSQAINGGSPGLYDLHGSVYTNFPGSWSASAGGTLLQTVAKNGRILQELHSEINGKMIQAQTGPTTWSGWSRIWDNDILPVSTTGLAVVTASSQAAARAAIGLAQAEILIHSDFGRSATTDVWQSAFTNNTASGLQLAANTTATGTEITIEQVVNIPADGGAAAYQVYIGPQLTGEDSPTGSTYADVIDPNNPTEYGAGTLRIKIELIGSGSSITGYVTSVFECSGSNAPFVRTGAITIDGTIANSIDIRFNPDSQTGYIIRRNRVFRRNP